MIAERFTLDTNILVYSIDSKAGLRGHLARRILDLAVHRDGWLTLQAVSEFYAAATRKGHMPPADAAAQANDWLDLFPTLSASAASVRAALRAASHRHASYWDALLVATAAEGGCTMILTEDLADGTLLDGVRIVNPFGETDISATAMRVLTAED
jgi:predicted nucleic acid-binding protein